MNTFHIFITKMPKPVRYGGLAYCSCLVIYNICESYIDAKKMLMQYRENKLTVYQQEKITCEWEAVKYGSHEFFWERFWNSVLWPITITNNIIPSLVLYLNNNNKKIE